MDITIVIPVYNRKALLRHTLDCITTGPAGDIPVIVVDNGSTDGTDKFLESYCASHPSVTTVSQPERGAAAARNKGLSLVGTKWVYFFDSDDRFEDIPHSWDSSADMIAFPTRQKTENKVRVRAYKPVSDPAVQILNGMLNTISMIFRTSWLRQIGGWNTSCRIWDDWELGIRALAASPKLQWITSKPYHTIIVHSDSLTGPSFKARYKLQLETIGLVLDDIRNIEPDSSARCRKALLLRTYILSGKLLYEGDRNASAACRDFILEHFGSKPDGRLIGRFLEQYTAMGLRGAWRIALRYMTNRKQL